MLQNTVDFKQKGDKGDTSKGIIQAKEAKELLQSSYGSYASIQGEVQLMGSQAELAEQFDTLYAGTGYTWEGWAGPQGMEGFATGGQGGTSYVDQSNASVDTVPHEMLHTSSDPLFKGTVGVDLNEGVTEMLTIKAVRAGGYTPSHSYPTQEALASTLVSKVGMGPVLQAYFNGKMTELGKAFSAKCGDWAGFVSAVKSGAMTQARSFLS